MTLDLMSKAGQSAPDPLDWRGKRRAIYKWLLVGSLASLAGWGASVAYVVAHGQNRDFDRWYKVAQRVHQDDRLADLSGAAALNTDESANDIYFYKLPPAFAFYVSPVSYLPYPVYVGAWYVFSALCGAAALLLAMRMAYGRFLPENPLALFLPLVGTGFYTLDDLKCGNNNLQVLVLIVLGLYLALRKRTALGGLAVGLAITIKAFPLALLAPLALMRRWKLAAWCLVGVVVWTLVVPGAFRGFGRHTAETRAWFDRIVGPYLTGQSKRQWATQSLGVKNQSLWALVNRLTTSVDCISGKPQPDGPKSLYVNFLSLSPKAANVIFVSLLALAAGAIAAVCWRRRGPPTDLATLVDFAIATNFTLLCSQIGWAYFYTLLLLPMTVGAYLIVTRADVWRRAFCWAFGATLPLMALGLWVVGQALGTLAIIGVGWLVMMIVVRWKISSLEASGADEAAGELLAAANTGKMAGSQLGPR